MNEIKITPELLAELKDKAEKANPEPYGFTPDVIVDKLCLVDGVYIDVVNPSVVLALIAEIKRLRHKEDFYVKAMAEYHQVAKMAWDGEIPSPLPGHESSEEKMIEQFEYLNCPACGGSGHVGDCDEAIQAVQIEVNINIIHVPGHINTAFPTRVTSI